MPQVSVFMDVEDPVNPAADDAALAVLKVFEEAGVRGSFCITGEKCRTLVSRGRQDVLDALRPHCLGLHTDTHSFHPTTMELLADAPYEEGCPLALAAESKGLAAFQMAFPESLSTFNFPLSTSGRIPSFWGGAGNTWSPEIAFALRELGIPAFSYSLLQLPGDPIHRFLGTVALPQHLSVSEPEWADDGLAEAASRRVLASLSSSKTPWIGVFVGHPTKLRHRDYWDTPYFAGRTPPEPEFVEPLPLEVFERSLRNLGSFLAQLRSESEVIGVDALLASPLRFRPPTEPELAHFRQETPAWIRGAAKWPVHRPGLDPENIVRKTLAQASSLEVLATANL